MSFLSAAVRHDPWRPLAASESETKLGETEQHLLQGPKYFQCHVVVLCEVVIRYRNQTSNLVS